MKDIISNRRKELGFTQQELAQKLQISDKVVSKWETGRSLPDTSMLVDLANALELSVNDLLNVNTEKQNLIKEINAREVSTKFKNLFIITMTIQIIATVLISVGRILLDRVQYYGQLEYSIVCYILIILAALVEIGAISYFLVVRNNLLNRYSTAIDIDKKYINWLLLFTYIIVFAILLIFIVYHGLSDIEQLISLTIFACLFAVPFILLYIWNRKRDR